MTELQLSWIDWQECGACGDWGITGGAGLHQPLQGGEKYCGNCARRASQAMEVFRPKIRKHLKVMQQVGLSISAVGQRWHCPAGNGKINWQNLGKKGGIIVLAGDTTKISAL